MTKNWTKLVEENQKIARISIQLKDMGNVTCVLAVKIFQDCSKLTPRLTQETYTRKNLECFNMSKAKSIEILVAKNYDFSLKDCPKSFVDQRR